MKHPDLSLGSRGGAVQALQHLLNEAERAAHGLSRDGIFGPLTKAAVFRFQRKRRLQQDGIVGRETWAALGHALRLPQLAATAPKSQPHPQLPKPAPTRAASTPVQRSIPTRPTMPPVRPAPVAAPAEPAPTRAISAGAIDAGNAGDPTWYQIALAEFAAHHTVFGTADGNKRIHEYFLTTSYHPGVGTHEAWCSAFANWCMKQAGVTGTHLASAASWLDWGVELAQPRRGCIMVIRWAHHSSGSSGNHVTFYESGNSGAAVHYFGGNQGARHQISHSSATAKAVASIHYRWPA